MTPDTRAPAGAQDKLAGRIAQIASAARQFAAHHEEFALAHPDGYRESLVWLTEAVHEFEAALEPPPQGVPGWACDCCGQSGPADWCPSHCPGCGRITRSTVVSAPQPQGDRAAMVEEITHHLARGIFEEDNEDGSGNVYESEDKAKGMIDRLLSAPAKPGAGRMHTQPPSTEPEDKLLALAREAIERRKQQPDEPVADWSVRLAADLVRADLADQRTEATERPAQSRTNWEKLREMSEEEIERRALEDEDNPLLSDAELATAELVAPGEEYITRGPDGMMGQRRFEIEGCVFDGAQSLATERPAQGEAEPDAWLVEVRNTDDEPWRKPWGTLSLHDRPVTEAQRPSSYAQGRVVPLYRALAAPPQESAPEGGA